MAPSGNLYDGLWYPIVVAAGMFVIDPIFPPETKVRDIHAGDASVHPGDVELEFEPMAPSV